MRTWTSLIAMWMLACAPLPDRSESEKLYIDPALLDRSYPILGEFTIAQILRLKYPELVEGKSDHPGDQTSFVDQLDVVEGPFLAFVDGEVEETGPALAVLLNIVVESGEGGVTRATPEVFVVALVRDSLDWVALGSPDELSHEIDGEREEVHLDLTTLALAEEASAIVVTRMLSVGGDYMYQFEETTRTYFIEYRDLTPVWSLVTSSSRGEAEYEDFERGGSGQWSERRSSATLSISTEKTEGLFDLVVQEERSGHDLATYRWNGHTYEHQSGASPRRRGDE